MQKAAKRAASKTSAKCEPRQKRPTVVSDGQVHFPMNAPVSRAGIQALFKTPGMGSGEAQGACEDGRGATVAPAGPLLQPAGASDLCQDPAGSGEVQGACEDAEAPGSQRGKGYCFQTASLPFLLVPIWSSGFSLPSGFDYRIAASSGRVGIDVFFIC